MLAAVDFDLRFSYVLAGWEGLAHDSVVLRVALKRSNGGTSSRCSCFATVDVSPPIACHGGTRGSMFGLRHMLNSMVNTRDSRFILVQALDHGSSNNLTSSRP